MHVLLSARKIGVGRESIECDEMRVPCHECTTHEKRTRSARVLLSWHTHSATTNLPRDARVVPYAVRPRVTCRVRATRCPTGTATGVRVHPCTVRRYTYTGRCLATELHNSYGSLNERIGGKLISGPQLRQLRQRSSTTRVHPKRGRSRGKHRRRRYRATNAIRGRSEAEHRGYGCIWVTG